MATGVVTWSTTAASNASADSNVNFAEGQAPSSLNDSSRALMASVAKFRDDTNGSITTGGSSSAYTVTSNQSFASLSAMSNAVIAFVPHATNAASPTLSVDGLTAKNIRFTTGADIPDGVLIEGTPYVVTYFASVGEFILHNLAGNPYGIPLGGGMDYWLTTAPNSAFVFPYGQAISRTTYATLFAGMSTTHGAGDGSTTFNLPDKRGRVSAGKGNMGGSDAARLTSAWMSPNGTTLGATGGEEDVALVAGNNGPHSHTGTTNTDGSHRHAMGANVSLAAGGATFNALVSFGGSAITGFTNQGTIDGPHAHDLVIDSQGSGTPHLNIQPTIICNYIMRII